MKLKKFCLISLFFIRFILFIFLGTSFIIMGTITLHEIGHSLAARYYQCPGNTIIFEQGQFPHTKISCHESASMQVIILSGILATSIFSLLLFFSMGGAVKYVGMAIFAVGLVSANRDLTMLSVPQLAMYTINFIGFILVGFCVMKITIAYFKKVYPE